MKERVCVIGEGAWGTVVATLLAENGFMVTVWCHDKAVAQQINPGLVDQAQGLQDSGVFDTAAIAMLASAPILQDIVSAYLPNLEKAVDNLGRVLLTLWLKEEETKEAIGDEAFSQLEEKLRGVFKNIGEVVLELGHNATTVGDEAEKIQSSMGGRPNR